MSNVGRLLSLLTALSLAACVVDGDGGSGDDEAADGTDGRVGQPITVSTGTSFYVSPAGSASGDGSLARPWDIKTALAHPAAVKPGDTIWLRGGVYGTGGPLVYTSLLKGTATAPIKLRQSAGERATVNAGIKTSGSYTWFWGFEITNTSADRDVVNLDTERPVGIRLVGTGNKAINLVIHDVGRAGVGFWSNQAEVYGTLFWGNGIYDSSGVTRGDPIYANVPSSASSPVKLIGNCISFRDFNLGFKVYSEWSTAHVNGFTLEGNVAFDHPGYEIVAENRHQGMSGLRVVGNYTYKRIAGNVNSTKLGYDGVANSDATIQGNYLVGTGTALGSLFTSTFSTLTVTGNTVVGTGALVQWQAGTSASSAREWNRNTYFGGNASPFKLAAGTNTFSNWKSKTGFDGASTYSASLPAQTRSFVIPNRYETGRAHVVVYNWESASSASVDLSAIGLRSGQAFEVRDAQNFFGPPVYTGTYSGGAVSLNLNLSAVAPIIGNRHLTNTHTEPKFNVFVVLPRG